MPVILADDQEEQKILLYHNCVAMLSKSVMIYCETNLSKAKALVKTALSYSIVVPFKEEMKYMNPHFSFYTSVIPITAEG